MLTIKNLVRNYSQAFLTAALFLSGCTPPGPRALREGNLLLERGHYAQAVEKLNTATTLLPTNALAWNCLGLACHYVGKTNEAQRAYLRALQLNRDLAEAHYNLGCLWLETDNPTNREGARLELTAYTLRRPNSVDGLLKLGSAQLRSRDFISAEKSYAEALRFSPQNAEALNGLGLIRFQRGRVAEAAAFFNSALQKRPNYPPALLNLAIVSHQFLRDRPFALQKYHAYLALKPAPQNAEAVAAVARQLEQDLNSVAHSPAPANPLLENTNVPPSKPPVTNAGPRLARVSPQPKVNPATITPKSASAPALLRPIAIPVPAPLSSVPEAGKPLSEPLPKMPMEVRPKPPAPTLVHSEPTNPALPAARQPPRPYTYLSPAKPAPGNRTEAQRAFDQGLHNQEAHRWPESIQAYQLATRLDPSFYEAHYNLGRASTEVRNLPVALAAYEYALAIKPDSADARYNFALVLKQANYLTEAARELERLLAQDPTESRAHLALANLYVHQLRQPAKARAHYLKVLELDPQLPQASAIRDWLSANPG